jgi:hypothetical protein
MDHKREGIMKRRSPAAPLLLPFITFGIYSLVWLVKTKNEINLAARDKVPTAWLLIVPFVNIWWQWKFAVGAEQATNRSIDRHAAFWLLLLLGPLGALFVQIGLNAAIGSSATSSGARREPVPA